MPKQPKIEYAQLRKFFEFYVARYVNVSGLPPEAHPVGCLELLEKKHKGMARVGLRQAINDCIEESIRLDPENVRKVDIELHALGIVTLSEVRRQYDKRFARIKDRGKIRDETEYYLVRNVLLDRAEKRRRSKAF